MIKYILCALLGYFAGCFSPSYLLSRRRGFDIRTFGSGNAGATNMMLAAGLKPGLVVMALDVSKAFVVTFPLRLLLPPLCAALAGLFCVLGHIFPVFLHFRGGKGTACLVRARCSADAGARVAAAGADVYHRHDLEPGEHPARC